MPVGLLVGAITVAGLVLRLPSFGDSLFGDEVGAYWIVTGHSFGQVIQYMAGHVPSPELNPPLWFVLAWVSEKLFGASTQSLKLVSLVAGTATIPLTYVLGRLTVGVRAGLLGCAIVALSPFLIYYSTEARPYALLVLLCLLSTLALLRAVETGEARWWALYATCVCGAAYTHFTSVFFLLAQFIWAFLAHPRARRRLVITSLAAAVAFAPWVPSLIRTARSPGTRIYQLLEPFGLHAIRIDLGRWAIGHPYLNLAVVPGDIAAWLICGGVLVGALGAVLTLRSARSLQNGLRVRREVVLVVVLAGAAPVGVALYSALRGSVWSSRNIISSWSAFAVVWGALLLYARAPLRAAAVLLVLAGLAIGAVSLSETVHQRPDYQSAAAYIDRIDHGNAPVVEIGTITPGPPTEMEAALALDRPRHPHPVLRVGVPTLAAILHAPAYTRQPIPSGEKIARQAARLAGNGRLIVVGAADLPFAQLEAVRRAHVHDDANTLGRFESFLGALPARFRPVTARAFPGFATVKVYVYRG